MDTDKRKFLLQRREQLQNKLEAEEHINSYLEPALEVLDYCRQQAIGYRIVALLSVPQAYRPHVAQCIQEQPYKEYGFAADNLHAVDGNKLLEQLWEKFPSTNEFRYVPDLPCFADYRGVAPAETQRDGLQRAVQELALPEQNVYLCYLRYGLLLEVQLEQISRYDTEELFNTWHGDTLLFAEPADWLIAFTMEDEWYGGKYA